MNGERINLKKNHLDNVVIKNFLKGVERVFVEMLSPTSELDTVQSETRYNLYQK